MNPILASLYLRRFPKAWKTADHSLIQSQSVNNYTKTFYPPSGPPFSVSPVSCSLPPSSPHTPLTPSPIPTIACPTYEPCIPGGARQPKHPFLGGLHQAPTKLSGYPQDQPHRWPPPSLSVSWHHQPFCSILCTSHTNHSSSPVAQLQASSSPT